MKLQIGVKFFIVVRQCLGCVFCLLGVLSLGDFKCGAKKEPEVDSFWPLKYPFYQFDYNYLENGTYVTPLRRLCKPLILRMYNAHTAVAAAFNTQHAEW